MATQVRARRRAEVRELWRRPHSGRCGGGLVGDLSLAAATKFALRRLAGARRRAIIHSREQATRIGDEGVPPA